MVDVPGSRPRSLRPTYPVRGERLLLRPLAIGDADTLLAYRSREDVCRYVPFEPMSRDDIIERIPPWADAASFDVGGAALPVAGIGYREWSRDAALFRTGIAAICSLLSCCQLSPAGRLGASQRITRSGVTIRSTRKS